MLAVVENLSECDDNTDGDSNDDQNEWTCERRHVDTARFIDVQRRLDVRHHPLHVADVPTLTSLDEPTTLQRLQDTHSEPHSYKSTAQFCLTDVHAVMYGTLPGNTTSTD